MKKVIALLTVFALCLCISIPAFAAESSTAKVEPIIVSSARGTDYGNAWISSSGAGSFTVTTSKSGTIYMTLKVESSSSSSFAEVSVQKPDKPFPQYHLQLFPVHAALPGLSVKNAIFSDAFPLPHP